MSSISSVVDLAISASETFNTLTNNYDDSSDDLGDARTFNWKYGEDGWTTDSRSDIAHYLYLLYVQPEDSSTAFFIESGLNDGTGVDIKVNWKVHTDAPSNSSDGGDGGGGGGGDDTTTTTDDGGGGGCGDSGCLQSVNEMSREERQEWGFVRVPAELLEKKTWCSN